VPREPLTLRLPFKMVDEPGKFNVHRLLAEVDERSSSQAWGLKERFEMSSREERFVRGLLSSKRNLWLYRCNQRRFCGDFIAVDMAAAAVHLRPSYALELKADAPLKVGVGPGVQMANLEEAYLELIDQGVLQVGSPYIRVTGDGGAILDWLRQPMSERDRWE
jgi:hypothetical protein